ncbi:neogenin/DCC [Apostichopus japonicus]|uniref:Neogenin/DCC n=1 Tax=Stichopus japonicus TaxID=307972 RepID=A0A2G8K269_STIJA|nr:neogenin/DCC [Apostichopus japonicus]
MPLRATVSRISSRTAFASWDPPQTTNGEFIRYRVSLEAVNDPSIRTRIISVSQETSKLIRDLRPDTQYRLKVLAINDNGPGENSNPIVFTTEEAVQVPEQPQNLEAMTQSSTSVLVTWQPPIDTFGDLEGYRLYYAKQNGLASREEELLVRGTSTVVEGLDPFTNYGFRVIAVNENGPGESTEATQAQTFSASEFLLVITLLHKKQHASRFLHRQGSNIYTHNRVLLQQISLQNQPPLLLLRYAGILPALNRNGVITEYRIRYRMVGSKDSKADIKAAGSLRSYIVSELERNNVYEFKIAALTSNGTGPFTEDWLQEYTTDRDQSGKSLMLYTKKILSSLEIPFNRYEPCKNTFHVNFVKR